MDGTQNRHYGACEATYVCHRLGERGSSILYSKKNPVRTSDLTGVFMLATFGSFTILVQPSIELSVPVDRVLWFQDPVVLLRE